MKSSLPRRARIPQRLLVPLFFLACTAGASGHSLTTACERPAQLRFSVIPQGGMQQSMANMRPLLGALEEALKVPVVLVESHSYGAVVEGLLAGAVDLARLGPASYVAAKNEDSRITAFASYARRPDIFDQEGATYHSLLIVNASGPYPDLQALRGRKVALVDPDSTSGAVIPRHMVLRKTERKLEEFFGPVRYTGNHDASIRAVLHKEIPAAFVSSSHLSDMVESGKMRLRDVRIVWRSAAIQRDPFVYRGQLCKDIKQKIASAFLRQEGRHYSSLLENLHATRFFPVSDSDYQDLRALYKTQ